MKKIRDFIKTYVPKTAKAAFISAAVSALVLTLSVYITPFADAVNSTVSTAFRILMSVLSSPFPFSVVEVLVCLIPIALVLLLVYMFKKVRTKISAVRFLFVVFAVPAFIFSGFVFALGVPYHTTGIAERMQISEVEIDSDNLERASLILRDEVNSLADELSLSSQSPSKTNLSFSEISQLVTDAYGIFEDEYGFPFNFYTRAKPMIFDEVMSSSHLLGIYTFFTGESNINDGYPDYTVPFTVAHEFAHQRGIIREDEANFLAFAVCIRSPDPYVRYSGYLNMYEYTVSALYKTDMQAFIRVHSGLSEAAFCDIAAANEHSKKYRDSKLGEVVSNANDAYLQMNGTPGRVSYSLSVRLTVAYYDALKK